MTIQHYLKYKTPYEALLWTAFLTWQITANVYVALDDTAASAFQRWEPILWESSSSIVMAMIIPLLIAFDRRFPIHFSQLKTHLPIHILATIPFCLLHVLGMVLMRKLGYWYMGSHYDFGHWPTELLYEYAKDFRTYFYLLVIIYLYRLILFRAQGEASVPYTSVEGAEVPETSNTEATNTAEKAEATTPDEPRSPTHKEARQHLLVKKLGKEFIVRIEEIVSAIKSTSILTTSLKPHSHLR